jgi:hypothetical protein
MGNECRALIVRIKGSQGIFHRFRRLAGAISTDQKARKLEIYRKIHVGNNLAKQYQYYRSASNRIYSLEIKKKRGGALACSNLEQATSI